VVLLHNVCRDTATLADLEALLLGPLADGLVLLAVSSSCAAAGAGSVATCYGLTLLGAKCMSIDTRRQKPTRKKRGLAAHLALVRGELAASIPSTTYSSISSSPAYPSTSTLKYGCKPNTGL